MRVVWIIVLYLASSMANTFGGVGSLHFFDESREGEVGCSDLASCCSEEPCEEGSEPLELPNIPCGDTCCLVVQEWVSGITPDGRKRLVVPSPVEGVWYGSSIIPEAGKKYILPTSPPKYVLSGRNLLAQFCFFLC